MANVQLAKLSCLSVSWFRTTERVLVLSARRRVETRTGGGDIGRMQNYPLLPALADEIGSTLSCPPL